MLVAPVAGVGRDPDSHPHGPGDQRVDVEDRHDDPRRAGAERAEDREQRKRPASHRDRARAPVRPFAVRRAHAQADHGEVGDREREHGPERVDAAEERRLAWEDRQARHEPEHGDRDARPVKTL